ncbi:hypothetical protein [Marinobacter sp. KMM 10035]|uniref:hypothetical protein n=1 Tax=Marinobacter sp. KMM 10035 TaxID=3134034 RepID=UPI00397B7CCD
MDRPILFNTEMVQAILDGRKTQTRRLVPEWQLPSETSGPHDEFPESSWISVAQRDRRYGFGVFGSTEEECMANYKHDYSSCCPYGRSGDRLWVRETHGFEIRSVGGTPHEQITYRASNPDAVHCYDCNGMEQPMKWRPSIHMPRWASRITLEITGVRVERLQDISEADAKAEGGPTHGHSGAEISGRRGFQHLWGQINGVDSWDANPWVWVIKFRRVD